MQQITMAEPGGNEAATLVSAIMNMQQIANWL
jgi:hypothetical protein